MSTELSGVKYVRAQWDYDALEENEISFKGGDMIKLIEAHNDDWYEGELDGIAGYFPANRVTPIHPESEEHLISENTIEGEGLNGNHAFHDDETPMETEPLWKPVKSPHGDTYYWNVQTGETTWKAPLESEIMDDGTAIYEVGSTLSNLSRTESKPSLKSSFFGWETDMIVGPAISGLDIVLDQFDTIPPELVRREGGLGKKLKKTVGGKEPRSSQSWRTYWAVLCIGWLVLYKDPPNKKKADKVIPVDIIPLVGITIETAGKDQTKKKNAFALSITGGVQWLLLPSHEADTSKWIQSIQDSAKEFCTEEEYDSVLTKVFSQDLATVEKEQIIRQHLRHKSLQAIPVAKPLAPAPIESKPKPRRTDSSNKEEKSNVGAKIGGFFSRNKNASEELKKSKTNLVEDLIFGGLLDKQVEKEGRDVPSVVEQCIHEVERRGLQSQGIYRLSGNAATVQKLRNMFNSQEFVRFEDESDINVVAAVLKLYFRELQNPLVPFEFYDDFIEASKISDYNERLMSIKALLHSMPKCNFDTFECLIRHMQKVASNGEINKMEPANLAIVFGPTLIRAPEEGQTALMNMMNMSFHNQIIETILVQADWMFTADSDDESTALA
ncbi:hypothetical protein SeMB42_g03955 [Synchytrium endobioticum]|uniref:Rho GTPase-activating protein 27 n=1 Tax=Synchytrium endobioticum TaxID=286115 RepID=A0A507D257_9FUNG|nr:hypothetical protein SeMB42_g03955 [Synchytrium endobioticum]TPX51496.1 hypothetical protein SeLEV6574_g00260 [Synchytrium endobioticum]